MLSAHYVPGLSYLSRWIFGSHSSNEDTGFRAERKLARRQTWFAGGDAELKWKLLFCLVSTRAGNERQLECTPQQGSIRTSPGLDHKETEASGKPALESYRGHRVPFTHLEYSEWQRPRRAGRDETELGFEGGIRNLSPSVTVVKLDPNELDWSGPATVFLLCVVSCTLDFILKELISFSYGCLHLSINHITFTLRQAPGNGGRTGKLWKAWAQVWGSRTPVGTSGPF